MKNRQKYLENELERLMLFLKIESNIKRITSLQSDIIVVQRELNQIRNYGGK
jgi:hypothetical protein